MRSVSEDRVADHDIADRGIAWECCAADGCTGVRLPAGERCWVHADQVARDLAAKRLGQDGILDARGVPVTGTLLSDLLAAAPEDERGNAVLESADFAAATFHDDAVFDAVTFHGTAVFRGAAFHGQAKLIQVAFDAVADFSGADFSGDAVIAGAAFKGHARFSQATFRGRTSVGMVSFDDRADFSGAVFEGDARFGGTAFHRDALFDGAAFRQSADFGKADIFSDATADPVLQALHPPGSNGPVPEPDRAARNTGAAFRSAAYFRQATFGGDAEFSHVTFEHDAVFAQAAFQDCARFTRAQFAGSPDPWDDPGRGADFAGSVFHHDAWFDGAAFSEQAAFDGVTFHGQADFTDATFEGDGRFRRATFGGTADFGGGLPGMPGAAFRHAADFSDATFRGQANFSEVTAERAVIFRGSDFEQTRELGPLLAGHELVLDNATFAQPVRIEAATAALACGRHSSSPGCSSG
ncbi:MAG: pentapeptide repeat-containing protein [Streptosporangiaceae bacterium]|nr:pentapeptide repeat-containing protein [Streptosporangiaceae bacterium]